VPDKLSKRSENAPGQWYVDATRTLCRLCLEEAPNLITFNRDETAVHFLNQRHGRDIDENLRRPEIAATGP